MHTSVLPLMPGPPTLEPAPATQCPSPSNVFYVAPATRLLSLHTPEQDLTEALHEFVERDNKESMKEAVARALAETQARGGGWDRNGLACEWWGGSGGWCDG